MYSHWSNYCGLLLLSSVVQGFNWVEKLSVNPLQDILSESGLTYDYSTLRFSSNQLDALYSYIRKPNRLLILDLLNRTDADYCSQQLCCAHRDDILRVFLNEESMAAKKLMTELVDLRARKYDEFDVQSSSSPSLLEDPIPDRLLQTANFILLPISIAIIATHCARYPLFITYIITLLLVSSIFSYVKLYQLKLAERISTLNSFRTSPCSPTSFMDELLDTFRNIFRSSRKSECLLFIESQMLPVFWEISPLMVFHSVWTELYFGWLGMVATHLNSFLLNILDNTAMLDKIIFIALVFIVRFILLRKENNTTSQRTQTKSRPRSK